MPASAPRIVRPGLEVRVECPPSEHIRLRIAVSPITSTLASLFEVVGGWRRGADPDWVRAMRQRADGIDLGPMDIFRSEARTVINALVPLPTRGNPTFEEELAVVVDTARPDVVRRQLREDFGTDLPAAYRPWQEDPAHAAADYVDCLAQWWRVVIAPEWPRMRAIIETEVLRVARVLATAGAREAIASIQSRIRWEGTTLVYPGGPTSAGRPLGDREFLLVPMACGPDGLFTEAARPEVVFLGYGAPGASALFGGGSQPAADALDAMLGAGRAAVLRQLDGSSSMRAIGLAVGLTASTVCTHLHALEEMALVHRGRIGRYVMYTRTSRGERLVDLL